MAPAPALLHSLIAYASLRGALCASASSPTAPTVFAAVSDWGGSGVPPFTTVSQLAVAKALANTSANDGARPPPPGEWYTWHLRYEALSLIGSLVTDRFPVCPLRRQQLPSRRSALGRGKQSAVAEPLFGHMGQRLW